MTDHPPLTGDDHGHTGEARMRVWPTAGTSHLLIDVDPGPPERHRWGGDLRTWREVSQ